MNREVTSEEFYKTVGPLNVTLEVKDPQNPITCGLSYPYTTLFFLKDSRRLIGFEKAGKYFLHEENVDHE